MSILLEHCHAVVSAGLPDLTSVPSGGEDCHCHEEDSLLQATVVERDMLSGLLKAVQARFQE